MAHTIVIQNLVLRFRLSVLFRVDLLKALALGRVQAWQRDRLDGTSCVSRPFRGETGRGKVIGHVAHLRSKVAQNRRGDAASATDNALDKSSFK